ncbi:MAG: hypothetical protein VX777_10325 [Chlamydiota bacterium]|nr:hypothetical protein [Chlamydiota bacterium]
MIDTLQKSIPAQHPPNINLFNHQAPPSPYIQRICSIQNQTQQLIEIQQYKIYLLQELSTAESIQRHYYPLKEGDLHVLCTNCSKNMDNMTSIKICANTIYKVSKIAATFTTLGIGLVFIVSFCFENRSH